MSSIIIKNAEQIANIREAGKYLTELLVQLQPRCKAGIQLLELEEVAEKFMQKNNLKGAFKGYHGFPANLCLSNNDCLVHGIPDKSILKNGDVLKIDCGVTYKGGIADSAITVIVGGDQTNAEATGLVEATKSGLDKCLQHVQPGKTIYERSNAIHEHIQASGYSIINHLTGHGVGVKVHEAPHIYNRPHKSTKKETFKPGMVIALEPITAITSNDFYEDPNGWNLYTTDGDIGAQREYTLLITENGHEILAGIQ